MPKISEEQRQARRLEILEVAERCFARQGFHRTTMEHIIRELKSSPGAVYCYFRGKNEIVAAIAEQRHSANQLYWRSCSRQAMLWKVSSTWPGHSSECCATQRKGNGEN